MIRPSFRTLISFSDLFFCPVTGVLISCLQNGRKRSTEIYGTYGMLKRGWIQF